MSKTSKHKHPKQPIIIDDAGVQRFKKNAIVRYLLDSATEYGTMDLNKLALMPFKRSDWEQFYQLIGYSVCGYCDLPSVSKKEKDRAWSEAKKLRERS